ncbi:MAG: hypothetical protein NUW01_04040 [Gemmatimonadaceae bacterium]|nr:hypothetical protein [Gemmatimonadaceae bacterium]
MMQWPWVSRRAYALLLELNERMFKQNAELINDLTRMRRFESGLTETKRPERVQSDPMPQELYRYIQGWGSEATRKQQRSRAYQRHQHGEAWDSIMADMMAPEPTGDTGLEEEVDDEQ